MHYISRGVLCRVSQRIFWVLGLCPAILCGISHAVTADQAADLAATGAAGFFVSQPSESEAAQTSDLTALRAAGFKQTSNGIHYRIRNIAQQGASPPSISALGQTTDPLPIHREIQTSLAPTPQDPEAKQDPQKPVQGPPENIRLRIDQLRKDLDDAIARVQKEEAQNPVKEFFPAWTGARLTGGGYSKVPAQMGANALRPLPTDDARPANGFTISIGPEFQVDRGNDYSSTLGLSIEIPVSDRAELMIRGSALEYFDVSPSTKQEFELDKSRGYGGGEIFIGSKFLFIQESAGGFTGDLAAEFWVSPTTGSNVNRRFTDSARFEGGFLYSKIVYRTDSKQDLLHGARVRGKLGFTNWDATADHQDDAVTAGLGAECYFRNGSVLDLDLRGYYGYMGGDKPFELAGSYTFPISGTWSCSIGGSVGLTEDAPDATVFFTINY